MDLKTKELLSNSVQTGFICTVFLSVAVYYWLALTGRENLKFYDWQWLGVVVFIIGTAIKWSIEFKHNMARTERNMLNKQDFLSTDGWYRLSRNPLYLSQLVIVIGAVVFAPSWYGAIALLGFFAAASKTIAIEERRLTEVYGKTYLTYKTLVGRWFLTPFQVSVYLLAR